ncbi:MAG: glycosyltransferase family 39 protein [Lachnospiraceae bacterium]|nr:glycosyltransferase family 39 protein [Lachnospiraceae bacterium]
MRTKIATFLTEAFKWIFFAFMTAMFICGFFVTGIHQKFENGGIDEFVIIGRNNLGISALVVIAGIALAFGVFKLGDILTKETANKKPKLNMNLFAGIVCAVSFILAIVWINILKVVPGADQEFCVTYADAMNKGDFWCLEQGHYLANYPHLLGLIAFLRLLFKIFGESNYDTFRYFNAICIPIMIYCGYRIVKKFTDDDKKTEFFYLLAMLFCIPVYAYVLYIYGDLGGPALGMASFWFFYQCLDKLSAKNIAGFVIFTIASITIRKNMLIFVIAMIVVLVVRLIKKMDKKDIILLCIIAVTTLFSLKYVEWLYLPEKVDTSHAVPAICNITMGLNDDQGYAGWYNYYELVVMGENDWEPDAASAESMEAIKNVYIPLFIHNPGYTADFFFRKINSQWQVPLYQSIVSNILLYGPQNDFVMSVYFGTWNRIFDWFMKIYQMAMYLFIAYLLFANRKEKKEIEYYTMLIAAFGGFLLSLVWESKARYIFPYFIIMIPFMAFGAKLMYERTILKIRARISKKEG